MPHPLARDLCKPRVGLKFAVGAEHYTLGGVIGDGCAGIVRKAVRKRDSKVVAVKFLAPDPKYIAEETFDDVAARFRREGMRGAQLDNEFLVKIHGYSDNLASDAFSPANPDLANPFIVMEYVPGKTLESYIHHLPDSERGSFVVTREKLLIAAQISTALKHLHALRIVHRDVKPVNVFVNRPEGEDPKAILGDFGVMKWGSYHAGLTSGTLTATHQRGLGTMKYMSPEQAIQPREVGVKSDIYALGITLYELFTGQIIPSPHHVFEITSARLSQGGTIARYLKLGMRVPLEDSHLAGVLLDMQMRGVTSRPTIDKVLTAIEWSFEQRFGAPWDQ